MNNLKVWPHLTIVAVVCAVLAGVGVGLWMKHEQTASAEALPNAARIQRVEGDVALNNSDAGNAASDQWIAATDNQPFSVGDRIYTRDNSRASVAFTGRNFARLNPNTSLDVLSLSDRRTQLALRDGSAIFDVGYLNSGDLFEVATPYGAVDFQQPGLYNVGIDNGQVLVSALSGLAQVVGLGGSGQISKGELLTLIGTTAADVVLSQINGRDAGYLVDDYYGYQYPQYYDGRYRDYNAYLNDPYYFDPYRRNVSYQYVNSYIPGLYDLDYYGDWRNVDNYGYVWAPRVDSGWTPYQTGYWYNDYPYGPTWVSTEPWGYAPYHYGRWAFAGDRWYWVPDNVRTEPIYSPALVAFVPFGQNEIGWVPLGPGDVYVPHYYNESWQPNYLTRDNLYQRVVNLDVPGAVTVVSVDDFVRGSDWRRARKADRNMLASANPVLDPLLLTPLRNAVIHSAWGRGKKDIPPGIAKKLNDTTVVTSTTPAAPPFRRDVAKSMKVDTVSERAKGQKFKVRDERQQGRGVAQQAPQAPAHVQQQPVEQRPRAQAQRDLRRVEQEQRRQQREQPRVVQAPRAAQAERAARPARQQAQGERVAAPQQRPQPQQQRQVVIPQQRPQPQMRRDPGPVRNAQPAARPQQQQKPERPAQAQQKQERPANAQPGGGGKGKGKKP
ncbi:MAG TPA: FecR family protein [Pyrinomonadaceae bacterium]|nr:FecR family protein [Pyrinomonadaceae bacterium]